MAHIKVYIFCQSEVGSGHYVRCNNIRKGLKDCNLQSINGSYTNEELKEVFAKQLKIINNYKQQFRNLAFTDPGTFYSMVKPYIKCISNALYKKSYKKV